MVLQRIQSVYLLIAVILMAVFAFLPALSFQSAGQEYVVGALAMGPKGATHIEPVMLVLVVLISLIAFIDIFLYRNLQRQMNVCFIGIVIGLAMLIAIGIRLFMLTGEQGVTVTPHWYLLLPLLSIVLMMLAHKAMARDRKTLLDADRLR